MPRAPAEWERHPVDGKPTGSGTRAPLGARSHKRGQGRCRRPRLERHASGGRGDQFVQGTKRPPLHLSSPLSTKTCRFPVQRPRRLPQTHVGLDGPRGRGDAGAAPAWASPRRTTGGQRRTRAAPCAPPAIAMLPPPRAAPQWRRRRRRRRRGATAAGDGGASVRRWTGAAVAPRAAARETARRRLRRPSVAAAALDRQADRRRRLRARARRGGVPCGAPRAWRRRPVGRRPPHQRPCRAECRCLFFFSFFFFPRRDNSQPAGAWLLCQQ